MGNKTYLRNKARRLSAVAVAILLLASILLTVPVLADTDEQEQPAASTEVGTPGEGDITEPPAGEDEGASVPRASGGDPGDYAGDYMKMFC